MPLRCTSGTMLCPIVLTGYNGKMITSNQNPRLKLTRALIGRAKERREENAFVAEGVRLVEEALQADWTFRFVLHGGELSPRGKALILSLEQRGVETEEVAEHLLNAMSDTGNTQGVLAVLDLPKPLPLPAPLDFVLIPDQIRDPGNLGTLLRSASRGWRAGCPPAAGDDGCLRPQGGAGWHGSALPPAHPGNGVGGDPQGNQGAEAAAGRHGRRLPAGRQTCDRPWD